MVQSDCTIGSANRRAGLAVSVSAPNNSAETFHRDGTYDCERFDLPTSDARLVWAGDYDWFRSCKHFQE